VIPNLFVGLQVKSIVKGSVADVCGKVFVGDEIIAINGMSVRADSLAGMDYMGGGRETVCGVKEREGVCARVLVCVFHRCTWTV